VPRLRLTARFTAVLVLLALLPLGASTLLGLRTNLRRLRRDAKEYALAVSDQALATVTATLRDAGAELSALGLLLADPEASVEERVALVRARILSARHLRAVALYDRAGLLVDSFRDAAQPWGTPPPERLPEAALARAQAEEVFPLGVVFPESGAAFLPLLSRVVRGEDRRVYGYLWAPLDLRPLGEELGRMARRRFGEVEAKQVYLFDPSLRIVAHSAGTSISEELPQQGFGADLQGGAGALQSGVAYAADYTRGERDLLGVLVPLPQLGWGLVVEQDAAQAYQGLRQAALESAALGSGFALLALALGVLLGRRMAAPIVAVARAAGRVAQGEFAVRVASGRRDEVGDMAGAFNRMAESLGAYEQRVQEETRIRTNLSRYLSQELVDQVVTSGIDLHLGGERRTVTVLFADVVAFTALAEERPPEQVVAVLNELFTFLTEIVFRHGGIVDKFVGDCVMAVFGVPSPQEDHALRAARAAEEMLAWLQTGNAKWHKDLGRDLELSIGLGTGEVLAGNLGSERRMEYTVIGDAVNVAARLEHLARPGQVLLSEASAAQCRPEFECRSLGVHPLRGRSRGMEVFELLS